MNSVQNITQYTLVPMQKGDSVSYNIVSHNTENNNNQPQQSICEKFRGFLCSPHTLAIGTFLAEGVLAGAGVDVLFKTSVFNFEPKHPVDNPISNNENNNDQANDTIISTVSSALASATPNISEVLINSAITQSASNTTQVAVNVVKNATSIITGR